MSNYKKIFFQIHMAILVVFIALLGLLSTRTYAETLQKHYSYSTLVTPKYKRGFKHFSYVNPHAVQGGEIKLVMASKFTTVNPYTVKGDLPWINFTSATIGTLLHRGLFTLSFDEKNVAYAFIAENIEENISKRYIIINVNSAARFNDNSKITIDDVIFTYETLLKHGRPFHKKVMRLAKKIEKLSDYSMRVSFDINTNEKHFRSGVFNFITSFPVLSKAYWESRDFNKTILEPYVSSGPYRISDLKINDYIFFEKNDQYWAKKHPTHIGLYNFKYIKAVQFGNMEVAHQGFAAGVFDFKQEYTSRTWHKQYDFDAVKSGKVKKIEVPYQVLGNIQGFVFNINKKPFDKREVRQAFSELFPYKQINSTLMYNTYRRLHSFFPNSDYLATGVAKGKEREFLLRFKDTLPKDVFTKPAYTYPPEVGKKQLKNALKVLGKYGYTFNSDKLLVDKEGKPFELEIRISQPGLTPHYGIFKDVLAKIGITLNIKLITKPQEIEMRKTRDYAIMSMALGYGAIPTSVSLRNSWHSDSASEEDSSNYSALRDETVDAMLAYIENVATYEDLVPALQGLDRYLRYLQPWILSWGVDYYRLAYWDKFDMPKFDPYFGTGWSLWSYNEKKAKKITP